MRWVLVGCAVALAALLLVLALSSLGFPVGEPPAVEQAPAAPPAAMAGELPVARDEAAASRRVVSESSGLPAAATMAGGILVRVRHAHRAAPAAGIGLLVRPAGLVPAGLQARSARTGRDGSAIIEPVSEGTYEVACDRGPRAEVFVTGGRTAEVELVLVAGLRVRGIVLDEDGNPVPYAAIRLGRADELDLDAEAAHCAANGTFALENLGRGVTLAAEAPDAGASFLHLLQGDAGDEVFVRLVLVPGTCSVRGRIVDAGGNPVAGARVRLAPSNFRGIGFGGAPRAVAFTPRTRSTYADAHGSFVLERVPSGQVSLSVDEPPFRRAWQTVTLVRGQTAETTIRLERGACVSGVVRDAEGLPVRGALVEWLRDGREVGGWAVTDSIGAYRLAGLEPKRFSGIRAYARGLGQAEASPKPGVGEELNVDFRLADPRWLRGRVVDKDGQPLAGWSVFASSYDPVATTDGEGRFGPVQAYPWADRVELVAVPLPRRSATPRAEWSGAWTREEIRLRVRREADTWVTGRVLDAAGAPLGSGYVWLQSRFAPERCDAEGRFRVGPPERDDRVWIVDPAAVHAPRAHDLKRLKPAEIVDLGDVRLARGALVSLRVESQVPLTQPHPRITLERAGREPWRTSAELEGRLLTIAEPIEPGAWEVTVEIAGFETVRQPIVVTDDPRPAATITLRAKK